MDPRDRLFAEIAMRLQLLTREQAALCAQHRERSPNKGLSDLAIELGFMSKEEAALVRAQEARMLDRQRRSNPPGALIEERVERYDPRSASSPAVVPPAVPAAAAGTAARKRRDPRAWEAPADPNEGQVHVPGPTAAFPPPRVHTQPVSAPPRISAASAPRELIDTAPSLMPPRHDDQAPTGKMTRPPQQPRELSAADTMPLTPAPQISRRSPGGLDAFPLALGEERASVSAAPVGRPSVEPQLGAASDTLVQSFSARRSPSTDLDMESPNTGSTLMGPGPSAAPLKIGESVGAGAIAGTGSGTLVGPASPTLLQSFASAAAAQASVQHAPQGPITQRPPKAKEQRPAGTIALTETYIGKALALSQRQGASDLHVHSGVPLMVRVDGQLRPLSGTAPLSPQAAEKIIAEIMTDVQWTTLSRKGEVDFALEIPSLARCRVNVYRQQRGLDSVFRILSIEPPTLEQLGLPARLARLTDFRTGMVLCTGPAGCGKSTTLAALLLGITQTRSDHVLTIEDPVEYVYPPSRALVNQRQVHDHTSSFARALRAALREDPDIIAITELRDRETISLAISAAETGHLVLGTLHTGNASQTIQRIISSFPSDEQEQIRTMLAESLRAVVSQRLVPRASGRGRVPALELLMVTTAVSNLIREDKTHQLPSVMQTGKALGMVTLDDSLLELVRSGTVSAEAARRFATKKERFS